MAIEAEEWGPRRGRVEATRVTAYVALRVSEDLVGPGADLGPAVSMTIPWYCDSIWAGRWAIRVLSGSACQWQREVKVGSSAPLQHMLGRWGLCEWNAICESMVAGTGG